MIASMTEESLSQELAELLEIVKQLAEHGLERKHGVYGPRHEMLTFMRKTLELYLLVQRTPAIQSESAFESYLNESAAIMLENAGFRYQNELFLMDLYHRATNTFYANEWATIICPFHSQFEALKQIYKNTSYGILLDDECEGIDDAIRRAGQIEGRLSQDEIPAGIPTSHWWWWYPNEPPETLSA